MAAVSVSGKNIPGPTGETAVIDEVRRAAMLISIALGFHPLGGAGDRTVQAYALTPADSAR